MTTRTWAIACAVLATVAMSGCAEEALIKSYPAGAKAYVDDQYIGSTPAIINIPRRKVTSPHIWKVEFRNCEPATGQLTTRIAGGRIAGYIFTVGFVALFRGPYYFPPIDTALTGGDCEPAPKFTTAPGVTVQQIVGDHNQAGPERASKTQRLNERLTTLRDLYNRKLISSEIYEQETQKAVKEMTD